MLKPTNFLGNTSLSSRNSVGGSPARVVGGEGRAPAKRTHQDEPTITVHASRDVRLTAELVRRLNLRAGQLIDLVPPNRRAGRNYWLLDTRPRVGGSPLTHTGDTRPKFTTTHHLSTRDMTVCVGIAKGQLHCRPVDSLTLEPNEGGPELPGVYRFTTRRSA